MRSSKADVPAPPTLRTLDSISLLWQLPLDSPSASEKMSFLDQYGPWAVIAGASEGTGAAFARQIAAAGIKPVLIGRRANALRELAAEIQSEFGRESLAIAVDLTAADAFDRISVAVGEREIGLFVANAGADLNGSEFLDAEVDAWVRLIELNVVTPLKLCHHFGRGMRQRGRGGIVLLGTGVSYGGMKSLAAYSGAKSFLLSFGESLWSELRPHGVHVLNLMLGRTDTPAFRRALAAKGLPLPAGLANAAEVAQAGLDRLPFGPVYNWGASDDEPGFAPTSANERRVRIARLEEMGKSVMK